MMLLQSRLTSPISFSKILVLVFEFTLEIFESLDAENIMDMFSDLNFGIVRE